MNLIELVANSKIEFIRISRVNHLGNEKDKPGMTAFFNEFPTVSTLGESNLNKFKVKVAMNPNGKFAQTIEWLNKKHTTMIAAGNEAEEMGYLNANHMFGKTLGNSVPGFLDGMYQNRFLGIQFDEAIGRNFYRFETYTRGTICKGISMEYVDVYTVEPLEYDETISDDSIGEGTKSYDINDLF